MNLTYDALIDALALQPPFRSRDEAERGLVSTLETLGLALPRRTAQALERELPRACSASIELGRTVADARRGPLNEVRPIAPSSRERVESVCLMLSHLLSQELLAEIERDLPESLSGLFEDPHIASHITPDRAGQARPGSLRERNPHGERKLSSSHRRSE